MQRKSQHRLHLALTVGLRGLQAVDLFEEDDRTAFFACAPHALMQHLHLLDEPLHAAAVAARLQPDGTLDLSCPAATAPRRTSSMGAPLWITFCSCAV